MRKRVPELVVIVLLSALGSCSEAPTAAHGPSWLHASLSSTLNPMYEGTGDFAPMRDYEGSPRHMVIFSIGQGSSEGAAISFRSNTSIRPQRGTYPIVPPEDKWGGNTHGWSGKYTREYTVEDSISINAVSESYWIKAGTLTITNSTPDIVEGTFQVTAVLADLGGCWRRKAGGGCIEWSNTRDPADVGVTSTPTLELNGAFRAALFDEDAQVGYGAPGVGCTTC